MTKPVLRGLLVVAFFALSAFYLVPVFVPRPAFIPGFAPPPDMWPWTVSVVGIVLGVLALIVARQGNEDAEEPIDTDGSSLARMGFRFAGLCVVLRRDALRGVPSRDDAFDLLHCLDDRRTQLPGLDCTPIHRCADTAVDVLSLRAWYAVPQG